MRPACTDDVGYQGAIVSECSQELRFFSARRVDLGGNFAYLTVRTNAGEADRVTASNGAA